MSTPAPFHHGKAQIADWECLNPVIEWCYHGHVNPQYLRGIHGCEGLVAWLILRGAVTIHTKNGLRKVPEGNWVVPHPGRIYREITADTSLISIQFNAAWAGRRGLFGEGLPIVFNAEAFPILRKKALTLARFVEKQFGQTGTLLCAAETTLPVYLRLQSHFTDWLALFIEALSALGVPHTRQGTMDERVRRGLFLIDRFALDRGFPKAELSKNAGLSPSQLDRLFVQATGHTPKHYFDQRRLTQARIALTHAGLSVKELAFSLGFRSVSHFSTWFRRWEGVSPTAFATRQSR